jgi:hypothetical protein
MNEGRPILPIDPEEAERLALPSLLHTLKNGTFPESFAGWFPAGVIRLTVVRPRA